MKTQLKIRFRLFWVVTEDETKTKKKPSSILHINPNALSVIENVIWNVKCEWRIWQTCNLLNGVVPQQDPNQNRIQIYMLNRNISLTGLCIIRIQKLWADWNCSKICISNKKKFFNFWSIGSIRKSVWNFGDFCVSFALQFFFRRRKIT